MDQFEAIHTEQLTNKEVCGTETVTKLRSWLGQQLKEINEDIETNNLHSAETASWLEKNKSLLTSKQDKEILSAADSQLRDMEDNIKLLENKKKVFTVEVENHQVEEILNGRTKKEVVEEITQRLNQIANNTTSSGEMVGVAEDRSGMVWGKQTYCHEYSSWTDLYETLLFYVDKATEEEG